jgi:hypothetical protein
MTQSSRHNSCRAPLPFGDGHDLRCSRRQSPDGNLHRVGPAWRSSYDEVPANAFASIRARALRSCRVAARFPCLLLHQWSTAPYLLRLHVRRRRSNRRYRIHPEAHGLRRVGQNSRRRRGAETDQPAMPPSLVRTRPPPSLTGLARSETQRDALESDQVGRQQCQESYGHGAETRLTPRSGVATEPQPAERTTRAVEAHADEVNRLGEERHFLQACRVLTA